MEKINFKNSESGGTPLNANNLNLMQDNIEGAVNGEIGQWTPIVSTIENKEPTTKYLKQVGEYIKYGKRFLYERRKWSYIYIN